MVKVSFNSALAQKDAKKEEEKSETLIIPEDKDPEDEIHIRHQSKTWCWCMCLGLALMLSGLVVGGAYLYRYFMYPVNEAMHLGTSSSTDTGEEGEGVFFCGVKYREEDYMIPNAPNPSARLHEIEERIRILEEDQVELINIPVPEFADSDPADIVHDFQRRLTAYLDLSLNRCYVIPLNTSIVMPPRDFLELLINIKAGTYLPQSYLIHEQMIVTDRIENVDQLGYFIYNLCRGKETYRLQRRDAIRGIQKREALNCHTIRHFENRFAVETVICEK
ncbi:integral membrane protein 2B isoform X3 [Acipenser ruthenus]|uniref:integral membrane protein 2B isoform X3 n=1 Tax=Acipenser ruthenus TaxID=7906 RepID=UPI0027415C08|nr:integral membrane protein 2B isoform X3 [Acipenser ruthenus]